MSPHTTKGKEYIIFSGNAEKTFDKIIKHSWKSFTKLKTENNFLT